MERNDFDIKESTQKGVGKGLFARALIKKGTFILEYTGIPMSSEAAEEHPGRYLFELNDQVTLDGDTEDNTAKYINHSCEPSVEAEIDEDKDGKEHINIYALRDIQAGEELFIDYDDEYFDEFIRPHGCQCGTPSCRMKKKQKKA